MIIMLSNGVIFMGKHEWMFMMNSVAFIRSSVAEDAIVKVEDYGLRIVYSEQVTLSNLWPCDRKTKAIKTHVPDVCIKY